MVIYSNKSVFFLKLETYQPKESPHNPDSVALFRLSSLGLLCTLPRVRQREGERQIERELDEEREALRCCASALHQVCPL